MAKLTRYLQKIFANNSDQVGVFGTGVDKETSKNVETLQSADYEEGWSSAIITNKNYPIWQEMDGVQYGLSYQLKYLFQNGIPEWLSTETYYTNSYCRVGSDIYYSLQDDNTNHNPALNDGWWALTTGANTNLSNLTTAGNARLQYAPFAINAGTVVNGENETLYTPTTPIEVSWTQPVLTSNGTLGGDSFAVGGMPAYSSGYQLWYMFDDGTANNRYESASLPAYFTFYNPKPIKVTNLRIVNNVERTDRSPKLYRVSGSNDNSTWTQLTEGTNTVLSNNASWNIDLSNNTNFYKYYKVDITSHSDWNVSTGWVVEVGNVYITAVEQAFVGTNLICDACTITTTDGRTKSFENSSTLDITGTADGTYSVFKDYTDGSLSLLSDSNFNLDTSTVPANLYVNNVINNDLVRLGTCTVSSNVITDVSNVLINNGWSFAVTTRYITETYHNGASFYRIYSDGWCVQGGHITSSSKTDITVTLLKPYLNTNYNIQLTISTTDAPYSSGSTSPDYYSAYYKTTSNFKTMGWTNATLGDKDWIACGYIN